jgi:hypothetical protein
VTGLEVPRADHRDTRVGRCRDQGERRRRPSAGKRLLQSRERRAPDFVERLARALSPVDQRPDPRIDVWSRAERDDLDWFLSR